MKNKFLKKLDSIFSQRNYLIYATEFDGKNVIYKYYCEPSESEDWFGKNNFTMYIKDARHYTKCESFEATKNTMLNSFNMNEKYS
jgi:hypothetical protein